MTLCRLALSALMVTAAFGCSETPAGAGDAGTSGADSGSADGGRSNDSGTPDGGGADAGAADSGSADAGMTDAGGTADSGAPDAGPGIDGGNVPSPPTSVVATAGNREATVAWTAPASNGGSALISYTVTSSPGALTSTVASTQTRTHVDGLTNGTTYTFTVTARNAVGDSAPSAPSNPVTPFLAGLRLPQPPLAWTAGNPCATAIGDFDEDGNLDVAVFAYDNSNGVTVLSTYLGLGNGAFGTRLDAPATGCPSGMRVGDFDQDGHLDLALVTQNYLGVGSLEVYYGLGDGTFTTPVATSVGTNPGGLAVADFNADGRLDVAVPSAGNNTVRVLLSQASPARTFASTGDFSTAAAPRAIAAGNLAGHGRNDLVVGCSPSLVEILVNDGSGNFSDGGYWDAGYAAIALAVADLNRDGHADVVALDPDGVDVLLSNGTGSLGPATHAHTAGNGVSEFVVADLNGDGTPDVALTLSASWALSVFMGKGDGTLAPEVMYWTDPRPGRLGVADLDKDGHLDVLVASDLGAGALAGSGLGNLQTLLGKGDGTFPTWQTIATNLGNAWGVAEGDLNGDGYPDLVATPEGDYRLSFALNPGSGVFAPTSQQVIAAPGTAFVTFESPVIADLNGDGKQDIAAASTTRNTLVVLLGQGNGNFAPYVEYAVSDGGAPIPGGLTSCDFNEDGRVDLVILNQGEGTLSVLLGAGKDGGTFPSYVEYASGPAGSGPSQVRTARIDGDAHQDLVVANSKGIALFLGNGDGTFHPRVDLPIVNSADSVAVGDFNGDGIADLAVAQSVSQQVVVALGAGDGGFTTAATLSTWPMSASTGDVAVCDLDGDGHLDIAISSTNSGPYSGWISVFRGEGDGGFAARQDFSSARAPYRLVCADFNRDGKTDLAASSAQYPFLNVLLNGSVP